MNKNERTKFKIQNSFGLFKIEAHLKYLQDVARSYLCPMPLYIAVIDSLAIDILYKLRKQCRCGTFSKTPQYQ